MEIERCLKEGGNWTIALRYKGQPIRVRVSGENIDDMIEGENPSEVTVLEALRQNKDKFERAIESALVSSSGFKPAEFSSLQIVRE